MVVDDELVARKMVASALQKGEFQRDLATDHSAALRRIETSDYELVVIDLRTPNKNGHEFAIELLARTAVPCL